MVASVMLASAWSGCSGRTSPDGGVSALDAPIASADAPLVHPDGGGSCELTGRDPSICGSPSVLYAPAGQEGMWAAVRIAGGSGFDAERVGYYLTPALPPDPGMPIPCSNGIAHTVRVFVGPAGAPPPAIPTILGEIPVPASAATSARRRFEHTLPSPVTVPTGSDLWVMIEMAGRSTSLACTAGCSGAGLGSDTYWSNAVNAPYDWAALSASSIHVELGGWVCAVSH